MIDPAPAISLAGLRLPDAPAPRGRIEWAKSVGARGVHLDGALAGLRPRELDRSARRDLASLLRRLDLAFTGLDLWIPPHHFAEAGHVDRAIAAVRGACDLAAELGGLLGDAATPVVSVELPGTLHADAQAALLGAELPAPLADHRRPYEARGMRVVPGLDAAAVLLAGGDPSAELLRLAGAGPSARLADADAVGRCAVGSGRLRVSEYKVACAAAGARGVILDLRGLDQPGGAAARALEAWGAA